MYSSVRSIKRIAVVRIFSVIGGSLCVFVCQVDPTITFHWACILSNIDRRFTFIHLYVRSRDYFYRAYIR